MKKIHVVRCALQSRNKHKLLLLHRAEHNLTIPGLWECPGGKVDSLQDLHIELARELTEETGLDVVVRRDEEFIVVDRSKVRDGPYAGTTFITHFITGLDRSHDRVKMDSDHDDHVWVGYDEALSYKLTPQTRKGLLALAERLKAPQ
jgi:8-oxo-dGTP diphosphatase